MNAFLKIQFKKTVNDQVVHLPKWVFNVHGNPKIDKDRFLWVPTYPKGCSRVFAQDSLFHFREGLLDTGVLQAQAFPAHPNPPSRMCCNMTRALTKARSTAFLVTRLAS